MKVLTRNEMVSEFALILEVSDDVYEKIRVNPHYYKDEDLVREATDSFGNNAIITMLQVHSDIKIIIRKLNQLLREYKTVSWYDRGHHQFYTRSQDHATV